MEQDEVEEGELSHDSTDEYTPLERPPNYSTTQPLPRLPVQVAPPSESEEEVLSNDNDSDSDSDASAKKVKKPKIRLKPKRQQRSLHAKKYNIWSSRLQEETLAATLVNCDVVNKDRTRSVESYDYTLAHKFYNNELSNRFSKVERKTNKRTNDDRSNTHLKLRHRSPSASDEKEIRGNPREIPELSVNKDNDKVDIARDIANKLSEEKEDLILKVIEVLGKERAIQIFEETKNVEAEGGMLIMNKTRRRTPGGVYLYLVRHDYHITLDQRNKIFGEERKKFKQQVKSKQKEKLQQLHRKVDAARQKLLPDLLTRAELLATQNPNRKLKESTETEDCVNPPPTPETDGCENSRDGMEGSPMPVINKSDSLENSRGKLNTYDDDFLDLGCGDDMDLF